MLLSILIVLVFIQGIIITISGRFQATTLYIGKQIVSEEILKYLDSRGAQDIITPKFQERMIDYTILGFIIIFILGTYIKWYVGVVGLILTLFLKAIFDKIFPDRLSFYTKGILIFLANKKADYDKNGDSERAHSIQEVYDILETWHKKAIDENLKVPSMEEAKNS